MNRRRCKYYVEITKYIWFIVLMKTANQYSKEEASQGLRDVVEQWLKDKPNRNISQLARNCEVSESCIRRILTNNSFPAFENVQKIINFLQAGKTHQQALSSLPNALSDQLKFQLTYLNFEELKNYTPMGEKEALLTDFAHKAIFERSCIQNGISLEEIKKMFGQKGETAVQQLIEAGLVEFKNGFYVSKPEYKDHSFSQHFYKTYLSDTIREFYKSDSQVNYIYNMTDGVSTKGYAKIMDILEATSHEIQRAVKEFPGDVPVSAGVFMDTMTYENVFSKKGDAQ